MGTMPIVNRTYRHVERGWLEEYLAPRYPEQKIQFEVRLTRVDPEVIARQQGKVSGRFGAAILAKLDALIELPDRFDLWEAKQYAGFTAISQLQQYAFVWPRSFEGKRGALKPLTLHLLASHHNRAIEEYAAAHHIEVAVFLPQWLRDHQMAVQAEGLARRNAIAEKIDAEKRGPQQ